MADYHNQFDDLERDLCEGLVARPAPEGFAGKVLARVANKEAKESRPALFLHWRSALAAVLIAVALVTTGFWQHQRRQRIAGERARAQVMLALHITSNTLDSILQRQIQHPVKEAQP